ncbi:hypothetical protein [Streptomyces flaveus]|uniref:Uncharacterized protein n=1 Tax=Streptomyces flaveus TaxID=66370 RepID=A0A917QRH1_9ACTN|nr:hypothetical protein [Streptomyces flaveus]GGK65518.1 hypothetical protein GCM10010094_28200 [Streptomyces flaveus]
MTGTGQPDSGSNPGQRQTSRFGYCSWHQGHSSGVRLISVQEQGSGPGGGQYACHSCRVAYDLVPFAKEPR